MAARLCVEVQRYAIRMMTAYRGVLMSASCSPDTAIHHVKLIGARQYAAWNVPTSGARDHRRNRADGATRFVHVDNVKVTSQRRVRHRRWRCWQQEPLKGTITEEPAV